MVCCMDTIKLILDDWRNTGAGSSENLKKLGVAYPMCKCSEADKSDTAKKYKYV